jgi:caspase domain-containing protein
MKTAVAGQRMSWPPLAATTRRAAAMTLALVLLALSIAVPGTAQARRLALVIGNDSYQKASPLRNARADARAVAQALRQVGFQVTHKEDVTLEQFKQALRSFKGQVEGGDEAVFYFSGHGVQFQGTNFLIPIDLDPESEDQVADDSVRLQRVLGDLQDQKPRFALAIIDACRNDPFKSNGRALGGRGLASTDPATGQMVMYSAGTGQEALDRLGPADSDPNGVFTRVLVKEILRPGVSAREMLNNVRDKVVVLARSVNHDQVPAIYDQVIGNYYFVPGGEAPASAAPAGSGPVAPVQVARAEQILHVDSASEREQSFWNEVKSSSDAADFRDYLAHFPKGAHADEAALRVRRLAHPAGEASETLARGSGDSLPSEPHASGAGVAGTYTGYVTTSMVPGQSIETRTRLASDGEFESQASNGAYAHGTLKLSDPQHVEGQALLTSGHDTVHMLIRGQIIDGVLHGYYKDEYETGELVIDLKHRY